MTTPRFNFVRFVPSGLGEGEGAPVLRLSLESAWHLACGIEPDVNTAIVPAGDFEILRERMAAREAAGDPARPPAALLTGAVEMRMAGAGQADYRIAPITIVEAEPATIAPALAGDLQRSARAYRVYLADMRHNWIAPRGGNLRIGLVNRRDDPDPRPNTRLIEICLSLMGLAGTAGPPRYIDADLDLLPPVRDLDWRGAHAPTELWRICQELGATIAITSDGGVRVELEGRGPAPLVPAERSLGALDLPGIDRRGKTVVFTSAPNNIAKRVTVSGPSASTWRFVLPDLLGRWVPQAAAELWGEQTPIEATRQDFAEVDQQYRGFLRDHAWRYIQLNPEYHPYPLLRVVWGRPGNPAIEVKAKVAYFDEEAGLWTNHTALVHLAAEYLHTDQRLLPGQRVNPSIIRVSRPLLKVSREDSAELWPVAAELSEGDLSVIYMREEIEYDSEGQPAVDEDGQVIPVYYNVGYIWEGGEPSKLSESDLRNALSDPQTLVVPMPHWVPEHDGESLVNESAMEAEAEAQARRFLVGSGGKPRRIDVRGFCQVELSGIANRIEIDQHEPRTTVWLDVWASPLGASTVAQRRREGERRSLRENLDGAREPVVPLLPGSALSAPATAPPVGSPVKWGKVAESWNNGNTVLLTPCAGQQDGTPTGQSVIAYIVHPYDMSPRPLDLVEGAIVPYVTVGDVSLLLPVRVATLDLKNSGSTAIATTRQINIPAATNGVLAFDGSDLKLGSGSDGQVLIWDNSQGKWVIDWVWLV